MALTSSKNISRKRNCSKPSKTTRLRVLLKFSAVVGLVCVSFLGGLFINSIYRSNNQKLSKRKMQRSISDFKSQFLNSFKAENLEENLR